MIGFTTSPARLFKPITSGTKFLNSKFLTGIHRPIVSQTSMLQQSRNFTRPLRSKSEGQAIATQMPLRQSENFRGVFWSIPIALAFAFAGTTFVSNDVAIQQSTPAVKVKEAKEQIIGRKVTYEELTLGSITGLFVGVIIGKLSSVISLLAISSYFFVSFLETRGIISIPWNAIINVGREKFDIKSLVFNKVGFKISFLLSFVIAAYNI